MCRSSSDHPFVNLLLLVPDGVAVHVGRKGVGVEERMVRRCGSARVQTSCTGSNGTHDQGLPLPLYRCHQIRRFRILRGAGFSFALVLEMQKHFFFAGAAGAALASPANDGAQRF